MNINTTTYYSWTKQLPTDTRQQSSLRLTPHEKSAIINLKKYHPEYGCSRISGQLRLFGIYVSSTTVFNYLKIEGLLISLSNRKPPEREPKYLAWTCNKIWSLDWTYIRIENNRYNLIALIDTFSKYLLGYSIVKTVKGQMIRDLVSLALLDQNLNDNQTPMLVMDQGSQNKAVKTRMFLKSMNVQVKYSEVARPTNNAFIERWYKTIKQELLYSFGIEGFNSFDIAVETIDTYIDNYNKNRPHSTIYNFTPYNTHYIYKNRSIMLDVYKQKVIQSRKERMLFWNDK